MEHLVERFAKRVGKEFRTIKMNTIEKLQAYHWPGNIRELQNVIERSVILSEGDVFSVDEAWASRNARQLQSLSLLPHRTPNGNERSSKLRSRKAKAEWQVPRGQPRSWAFRVRLSILRSRVCKSASCASSRGEMERQATLSMPTVVITMSTDFLHIGIDCGLTLVALVVLTFILKRLGVRTLAFVASASATAQIMTHPRVGLGRSRIIVAHTEGDAESRGRDSRGVERMTTPQIQYDCIVVHEPLLLDLLQTDALRD